MIYFLIDTTKSPVAQKEFQVIQIPYRLHSYNVTIPSVLL